MDAAKEEADRIVGEAKAKAERLTNEARGKADRLETDARIRAQKLDEETNERRTQAVATIERDRYEIQREVEHLRAYEREYRARLKNYFQSQLDQPQPTRARRRQSPSRRQQMRLLAASARSWATTRASERELAPSFQRQGLLHHDWCGRLCCRPR
ncbi:hypothetical protein [Aeromicrobium sp. UC242_57]|uniref:hypothetical protein n=1 Tax=Aeromicrobium sp. UC242_57 TaxID=3374624 RepID=UPI0037B4F4CE